MGMNLRLEFHISMLYIDFDAIGWMYVSFPYHYCNIKRFCEDLLLSGIGGSQASTTS